ncbi:AMP-binding enzyme [Nocardia kruczakiae]|uniref:AMP-binding enzyme n=1 Tax=Nocardia kruczakiae TaxID=261477 RepID=UPI00350E56BC
MVAVIGTPGVRWGEAVTAFVVPVPGTSPIRRRCAPTAENSLRDTKCPRSSISNNRCP